LWIYNLMDKHIKYRDKYPSLKAAMSTIEKLSRK